MPTHIQQSAWNTEKQNMTIRDRIFSQVGGLQPNAAKVGENNLIISMSIGLWDGINGRVRMSKNLYFN